MADEAVPHAPAEPAAPSTADPVVAALRQVLATIPAGCTWLLPVRAPDGAVADFLVAAVSAQGRDVHGRGAGRVGQPLSTLYPGMVAGPLWQAYHQVLATGEPAHLPDFRYAGHGAGVVADSAFDVSVHRVLGGLLVWWQRLDEHRLRLARTELLGSLGWAEYDLVTGRSEWSPGMYRIFERDPALGPMSRADQGAALLPADQGLREAAWQTLDSGAASDVTVRFRAGGTVKHLRILSDVARDEGGAPVKVYAVVQDVTVRENSRSAIEQLHDQLRTRETTALAEHRLAGQLQNLIQPVPREPVALAGLEVLVGYLPAESALRVGGDWYHAETLPDGSVVLAVGDVAGHGLEAASGMAHLRFALVAWLSIGIREPAALLGHLNRLCGQLAITGTAVLAVFDPATRRLAWARAGHPLPMLSRAGATGDLGRPAGMLLGADPAARYPVVTTELRGDDVLLLYTDGLTERRAGSPGDRLAEVRSALAALSGRPGAGSLARLRDALHRPSPDDDTCTLAVRVLP
ncbi:PP2C family protein-serine/threonine phosphatase [Micromonospora sp. AMSO31t]|uniref:PP2C family protein-serine/threonine phosphatase n=1 Tax=Micromonospora sp. AMSO31t TaxID=2650566 RepID=UPI00124B9740|nr:SpoIIE family protein phosphatase [Micromonospora sp. AMSO31t]KAB1915497.1 SpoIIE family protein phosphatase [Micromonospora sp. AMSO31t]